MMMKFPYLMKVGISFLIDPKVTYVSVKVLLHVSLSAALKMHSHCRKSALREQKSATSAAFVQRVICKSAFLVQLPLHFHYKNSYTSHVTVATEEFAHKEWRQNWHTFSQCPAQNQSISCFLEIIKIKKNLVIQCKKVVKQEIPESAQINSAAGHPLLLFFFFQFTFK